MKIKLEDGLLFDEEDNTLLNYIFNFVERGFYEPNFGKIEGEEITPDVIKKHNEILSKMEIEGLWNAKPGQGGHFFFSKESGVTTWTGETVANASECQLIGNNLSFRKNGGTFKSKIKPKDDLHDASIWVKKENTI